MADDDFRRKDAGIPALVRQETLVRAEAKARHRLENPDAEAERWFWLSFADPDLPEGHQHLGCTVVEAHDFEEAIAASHLRHVNPGGEVQMIEIEDDGTLDQKLKIAFMLNHLRTKAEMEAEGLV